MEAKRPNGRQWTPAEDALLGTDSDWRRRRRLGIPRSGKPAGRPPGTRNYENLAARR
jgi:hypothetical protein